MKKLIVLGLSILLILIYIILQPEGESIYPLTEKWEIIIPHQDIPKGILSLSASHCGTCHTKHYEEWKISTHAHAWTDMQFQAELKKESSPTMCINCHIPLQNQQEKITTGLIEGDIYRPVQQENPHFDKALQQEGITCAACHVRDNMIISKTKSGKAPHQTIARPTFLSEQLCISCHNAVDEINDQLVCTFETGDEWKNGPYRKEKNCIGCHMEETQRENVPGFGIKKSHFHFFPGSGIPKVDTLQSKIFNGLTFSPQRLKTSYLVADSLEFKLMVKNEFAGHKVPTGDPERFFLINFELTNTEGDLLIAQEERIGEEWEWHPVAKKIAENNLLPKEERTYIFSPKLNNKGSYVLHLTVTKHRMNQEAADYNQLGDDYPLFITIFEEKFKFKVRD